MTLKKMEVVWLAIVVLSFAVSMAFYPQMPDKLPSHWNAAGEVDGYMSRLWGLLIVPLISVGMLVLFWAIPRLDPLKANIAGFRKYYDGFVVVILLYMNSIQAMIILWGLDYKVSPNIIIPIGVGILFFCIGILLQNARRNWFVG